MATPQSTTLAVPRLLAPALTLAERLAVFREHGHLLGEGEVDTALGQRWLDKLKAIPPFEQVPALWGQFLEANQLTEDALRRALGMPPAFLAAHAPAEATRWVEELEEALAEERPGLASSFPWPPAMGQEAKLLTFSLPLISWAVKRIERGLAAFEAASGRALVQRSQAMALWLPPLAGAAFTITQRAMVLELNVCRLRGDLAGDTAAARFESFASRLEDPAHARALREEYAVLSRQVVESLRAISDFWLLFLRHLAEDRALLRETFFGGEDPGPLTKVGMSGDSHRGGKRVLVLEFEGGRRLLYKPRSMRVDEHFQSLLRWLNERGHQPALRTMVCVDKGDHGWAEFITQEDCTQEEQLHRFYARQGSLLAVLYAMLATDIHYENLIASGEHPVLIDLESLFHPTLRPLVENQLDEAVWGTLNYSVLRTALLPTLQFALHKDTPTKVGGLNDVEGQQSPFAAPFVDMSVADEARINRMKTRMSGSKNLPTLRGTRPEPSDYTDDILGGFTRMYGLLLANREALLAEDGPIRRFAGDDIRFIFRHTRTYGVLARETLHPDLQRDALERERHFLRMWVKLEQRQDIAGLVTSELRALWKGDVPFFYTQTDSTDILDERDQRHPNLLTRSCLDEVVEHIQRMDATDLQRQSWFIKGAMACQQLLVHEDSGASGAGAKGGSYREVPADAAPVSREVFLQEARRIGDRLVELALRGRRDEGATWVGMVFLHEKIWQFLPLGIDLYNGLSGIALFLAYLGRASGERRYTDLARDTLTVIRRQQRNSEKGIVINGGFAGWGGLLYLYTHLYGLWKEPQLLEEALHCARQMRARVDADEDCEIIYGSAGGLLTLNGLYELHPEPEVLELMRLCGQRILAQARPMPRGGVGWYSKSMGTMPLAGFSHGASGIATALEVLHRRTGQGSYREGAAAALTYERTLFSPEHGNWRDMRFGRPEPEAPLPDKFPVVWCNGAPGIGLARLRMRSLADDRAREEISVALDTTRREGFGFTHSLCHGDLGNLELFLEAREAGMPLDGKNEVERHAARILEGIRHKGWLCGTPRGVETPGMMTGLAGIGYGFLRLHDAARTPSMLLLDPPR